MSDEVRTKVTVQQRSDSFASGAQPYTSATETGAVRVSAGEPQYADACRAGRVYCISTAAGTAKAPVTSIGTTTAAFALWNGNAASTKYNLEIIEVVAFLVSGTAGSTGSSMMAGLSSAAQASAVSAYAGVIGPKSMSSSTTRTSAAILGGAITLAGAPVWRHIGGIQTAPVDGGCIVADLKGSIVVPPQFACGFTILSTAGTTPLWGWTITYIEQQGTLG